jgi:hypothetical protein
MTFNAGKLGSNFTAYVPNSCTSSKRKGTDLFNSFRNGQISHAPEMVPDCRTVAMQKQGRTHFEIRISFGNRNLLEIRVQESGTIQLLKSTRKANG